MSLINDPFMPADDRHGNEVIEHLRARLTAAEKENARLNHIQENGNPKLSIAIAELCGWSWDTKVPGAWYKEGKGWCHVLPSIPDMFAELKEKCDKAETRVKELERALMNETNLHEGMEAMDKGIIKNLRAELDKLKGTK